MNENKDVKSVCPTKSSVHLCYNFDMLREERRCHHGFLHRTLYHVTNFLLNSMISTGIELCHSVKTGTSMYLYQLQFL